MMGGNSKTQNLRILSTKFSFQAPNYLTKIPSDLFLWRNLLKKSEKIEMLRFPPYKILGQCYLQFFVLSELRLQTTNLNIFRLVGKAW
jgi:hypothetical protein